MSTFDKRAQTWDENPMHMERSKAIAKKMCENIRLSNEKTALEYGAGTGTLSFLLKDHLRHITMMDNSRGMVREMIAKISKSEATNMQPMFFDLENSLYYKKRFDLIYTQMVLHYVRNVEEILGTFFNLLEDGGTVAIADLYEEDGTFHGNDFAGHLGFDVESLSKTMASIGYKNIRHEQCFEVNKTIETGESKVFPLFLLIAEKA